MSNPRAEDVIGYMETLSNWGRWDNAHLERVAEAYAAKNRWEFCLSITPLRIDRATGSPVNPTAIF